MFACLRQFALALLPSGALLAIASCDFSIFPPPQPATSITISLSKGVLLPGETATASVYGTDANGLPGKVGAVTWSSAAPTIASVSSKGRVTAHQIGNASIFASTAGASALALVRVRSAFCSAATVVGPLPFSTPTAGTLTLDDCVLGYLVADPYTLTVGGPTTLALAITADPFTPAPSVTTSGLVDIPNGELGIGVPPPGGRFLYELAAGSHFIWMTSTGVPELGSYTITATSVTRCAPALAVGGFVLGAARVGSLDASDCYFDDGSQAEGQAFTLSEATFLTVTSTSGAFAPSAVVTTSAMTGFNAAFESSPNDSTRIQMFDLGPGSYVLWANPAEDDFGAGAFAQKTGTLPRCTPTGTTRPITIGATVVDSLTLDDCVFGTWFPRLADGWRLTLATPTRLQVDITNTPGRSFASLFLTTGTGTELDVTRLPLGDTKSRIEHQLSAGTYLLYASASGGAGAFTVEVRAIP